MPGPRSTSHIKQYTPTQFSTAIAAVSSGSLSIRKAAQAHSIPFSTLQRHFQGTPQAKRSYETSSREMQKLTPEQEENIAMWVLAQENLGLPVKMEDIRRFADKVLEVGIKEAKAGQTPKGGAGRRKSAAGGTGTPAGKDGGKEGGAGGEGEGSVTVGKHWGPKFMQRHPQLKAAREARRKELKKGLRGKQAVGASAASVAATNTPTAINNPTPAATNGAANGQTGQTAPTSAPVAARFAPPPQTPTPAAASGQRQRNRQKNGQQPQPQHQEHDDVDPELMEHDQDQTVIEDEEDQSVEDGEEEEDDDDDESIVDVKDEEEYEDEQTPDQQLLMDSQRYSRFAVAVNGGRH
ncbi:hypothetical protein QBC32DRAFT_45979 [Pseudoneurospora amorphoporcata]|uniref:HTH psq-type domain-containing protein n=1 Tax=Pseudoneurospora amorphoporcata TaxID=241081 RepID=A0AAN6NPX1_9PEZI|nr:hypothetical protein QBC32DRAFT_45979 [Pseudoneurospora amorphoporcata]